ncbi:acyl-CoA thioesterase [Natrinema salsiterrestre]|uniref:Acyl-[acyl-carrier-protein] thioesterase n=1 Tax=Natrinema salsiterrestre TaxID=2950540 RepID=A0A9Q4L5D2_9EURY|nr:acyl-[acyl-carrier-protein] thioesterase [Natrinema salsiterrestre]MDF9747864.1 acyl-[acyl-carrier-protein] thioesterase [Natrinema salsiterrestre]
MQTISDTRVRFGELAGPLVHGSVFFDWQLISTQEVAAAFGYSFEEILADGGIPYAPVVVESSVHRYPGTGDTITVETVPIDVGESSVDLLYEVIDGDGERLATARMTHVTISPTGSALPLPDQVQSAFADACADRDPEVGPRTETDREAPLPSYSTSFRIRSPYIEGAELAYFEEYPRFAGIALEEYLTEQGTSLNKLSDEKQPYRIRDWKWEFRSPVLSETELRVECDVLGVDRETISVAHELTSDGETNIRGITEYGCFDRTGAPVQFDEEMVDLFEP